ncbi:transformer-2 protein homolog beta-like isoform X2 [Gordionus sp. m RMFG-2023]|uniref:transformer-2 protein homolog beta-like isoform X2 n=1 Tax=Gordionus sp. m RMFG-2023 TaxID=3053472 RepID=UPI0031FBE875
MSPKYHSPSPANGYKKKGRRRSPSRSRSFSGSRSPSSYSRSYSKSRSRSNSRSRTRSPSFVKSRKRSYTKSRSRSPYDSKRQTQPEEIVPCKCLGVFGLSLYTRERDLREIFSKYGNVEDVVIVYDHASRRSRGFGFVYFQTIEDAAYSKEKSAGLEIDGRRIRVDFSITQRAHTPTPGIYMGKPTYSNNGPGYTRKRTPSPYYNKNRRSVSRDSRSASFTPPPKRKF